MGHGARRRGDAAFTEFAAASRARLRSTAYLLCGDWDRASDHVQEGLIRVYVAWPRLDRNGGELAYARKAVVSAFLDANRKRSSSERPAAEHADRASAEDVAAAVADRAALMAALARLPGRQRACVVLRYFEELDVRETAAVARLQRGHRQEPDLACARLAASDVRGRVPRRARRGRREEPAVVNELKELMRQNVAAPPPDALDFDGLVDAGRRPGTPSASGCPRGRSGRGGRCRRRRSHRPAGHGRPHRGGGRAAGTGRAHRSPGRRQAGRRGERLPGPGVVHERQPRPRQRAVLRRGHRRRADPVPRRPEVGPALPAAGPHRSGDQREGLAARPAMGQSQTWPVELGADRLVLVGGEGGGMKAHLVAYVFDRTTRQWSTMQWPGLPKLGFFPTSSLGPDGRLYASVPATRGKPPEGGWPVGADGEADDADADGDTYHLWSVSLTDGSDVRDEGLTVGSVAFTDTSMVWTDSTNGAAGLVHVRDLASGKEHSFDPHTGEKCNLLVLRGDRRARGDEPVLRHVRRRDARRPRADPHHGRRPGGHPPGQRDRGLSGRWRGGSERVREGPSRPSSTTSAPTGC